MSDEEQGNESHSFHLEGGQIVFDKPKSSEEAAREERAKEQHEFARRQVRTNKQLAWFTGLLVIATFCGTAIGMWQAHISQTAAQAARLAADAATKAAKIAEDTLTETQKSNARQASLAEQSRQDAKRASDQGAKQANKSLQATIDNFHQDQRVWLGFGNVSIVLDKTDPIKAETTAVVLGKSPAVDIVTRMGIRPFPVAHVLQLGELILDPKEIRNGTGFPGASFPVRETATDPISESDKLIVEGILQKKIVLYFYGRTAYRDIFNRKHWTEFCYVLPSANSRDTRPCEIHNDSDADPTEK